MFKAKPNVTALKMEAKALVSETLSKVTDEIDAMEVKEEERARERRVRQCGSGLCPTGRCLGPSKGAPRPGRFLRGVRARAVALAPSDVTAIAGLGGGGVEACEREEKRGGGRGRRRERARVGWMGGESRRLPFALSLSSLSPSP